MARNAPKHIDQETKSPSPPMRGGSPGMPAPNQPSPLIHGLSSVHPGTQADPFAARPEPKLKRYRVVGGPKRMMASSSVDVRGNTVVGQSYWDGSYKILYDGVPCRVKHGKEFAENQMDVALLQRQGIVLEEIVEAPKASEPAPEGEAPANPTP